MRLGIKLVSIVARVLPKYFVRRIYQDEEWAQRIIIALERLVGGTEGPSRVRIAIGAAANLSFVADLQRQKYFWIGTFEPWVQDAIVRYGYKGMTMWDIGAFLGFHSLVMRRIAGPGKVLAVEPDPESRAKLWENLTLNDFHDVVVLDKVVGPKKGRATLQRIPNGPSQTTAVESETGDCEMTSLDDLLKEFGKPGIIKMDIEGAESLALSGGKRVLWESRPIWLLETHGQPGDQAIAQLRDAHYNVTKIDNWHPGAGELVGGGAEHFIALPLPLPIPRANPQNIAVPDQV